MKKAINKPVLYNTLVILLFVGILVSLYFFSRNILIEKQTQILTLDRNVAVSDIEKEFTKIETVIFNIDSYINSEGDFDNIVEYMDNVAEQHDFISAMFFGMPDKTYFVTSNATAPPTFDLTQRPWYIHATRSNEIVYTEAYLDVSLEKFTITVAKSIYVDDVFKGVIGIDVDIDTLSSYFYDNTVDIGGFSFLVDRHGNLLTYSNGNVNDVAIDTIGVLGIELNIFTEIEGLTDELTVNDTLGKISYSKINGTDYVYAVFMPSTEITQSLRVFMFIGFAFLSLFLVVSLTIFSIYYFYYQKPLKKLIFDINDINSDNTYQYRLNTEKEEGFSKARKALNLLLDATNSYQSQAEKTLHDLTLRNQKYNLLLDSASDIVFQIDNNRKYIEVYGKGLKAMKKTESEFIGKDFGEVFNVSLYEQRKDCYDLVLDGMRSVYSWDYVIDGRVIYYETVMSPLYEISGEIIGAVGVTRDITEQEQRYQDMVRISTHDYLTGLNNRRFYIEHLQILDTMKEYPFGVMNIDVNGLKIINDAYGHSVGDEALIKTASILQENIEINYIVSRVSGDEFTIILPNADKKETQALKDKLLKAFQKINISNLSLSVAIGYHVKIDDIEDIEEVRMLAENDMFRHKISERKSVKNKAISAILKTLTEKYEAEKIHSEKVSDFSKKLGEALHLADDELRDLTTAAMFHDIGKISIPDDIINKPGKLTDREFEIMKSHTEVGYEILRAADEYSELAIYASSHHEKWDGSGYPRGLKGEKIPLFSRIISIADSFEAMTADRPYRKKRTVEYAASEIIKYAGTQFDPDLAKIFVEKVLNKKWTR